MDYGAHDDLTALLDAARAGEEDATRLFAPLSGSASLRRLFGVRPI